MTLGLILEFQKVLPNYFYDEGWKAHITVGEKPTFRHPDQLFFTNREIRNFITSNHLENHSRVGMLHVAINGDRAKWEEYIPFFDGPWKNSKIGVAQLIEYHFLREVKRRNPTITRIHHVLPSLKRMKQLKKRRILSFWKTFLPKFSFSYKDTMQKIREKIAQDTVMARKGKKFTPGAKFRKSA